MTFRSMRTARFAMLTAVAAAASAAAIAQDPANPAANPNIIVEGEQLPDMSAIEKGPEVKGIITARKGDKMKVTAADGTSTVIFLNDSTTVKASTGLFGSKKLDLTNLLNGLPVSVKTVKAGEVLVANQIT
ncbi:MAG: OmpA family protein, partial [Novosphingobium sp.]